MYRQFHPHVTLPTPFMWDLPYPSCEAHYAYSEEFTPPLGSSHLSFCPAEFPVLLLSVVVYAKGHFVWESLSAGQSPRAEPVLLPLFHAIIYH